MVASKTRQLAIAGVRNVAPHVGDASLGRYIQTTNDVEKGGLATPRRPEQHEQLALPKPHAHATKRVHVDVAHPVRFRDVVGGEHDSVFLGLRHRELRSAASSSS